MKKIIRILGLTLVLGMSLASCTKEVEILEPTLTGTYKYKSVIVSNPVDLDKDGLANNDLIKERGKECTWDNTWQYQGNKATLGGGETLCSPDEADSYNVIGSFDYIYDKTSRTIKIMYSGGSSEVLENVKIGFTADQKQSLSFDLWDSKLSQLVTYNLVSN